MRLRGSHTRTEILRIGAEIVREGGPSKLTFDEVAARLGLTKQAVLYWFPNKEELVASLALPALREEASAAIAALANAHIEGAAAVRAFARALIEFHLQDLDRFRLTYVAVQMPGSSVEPSEGLKDQIHTVTVPMYEALAIRLGSNDTNRPPRQLAVAVHMAVLGLVLMVSLADAVRDPLRHTTSALTDALIDLLAGGFGRPSLTQQVS